MSSDSTRRSHDGPAGVAKDEHQLRPTPSGGEKRRPCQLLLSSAKLRLLLQRSNLRKLRLALKILSCSKTIL